MALLMILFAFLFVTPTFGDVYNGYSNFVVNRNSSSLPQTPTGSNQICTAIYTVTLLPKYTVQGNDIGMLPPQGKNTSNYGVLFASNWADQSNLASIGADYTYAPYANDSIKQANARAQFSVTALTEPGGTPLGFKSELLNMHYSVCVQVRGVTSRWVEIMAESPQPDRKICVSDWRPDGNTRTNTNANPFQNSCGQGHLYACRPSGNTADPTTGIPEDNLNLRFYCENCDDESFSLYWRVVASQQPPVTTATNTAGQPDGEGWCMWRVGSDYPSSLLQPYPQNYNPPAVFEVLSSSASALTTSLWVMFAFALIAFLF